MPELRHYQLAAIDAVRKAMREGKRKVMLQIPTGGGKTLTAASMLAATIERGNRSIFACHRLELIDQTVATFARLGITSIGVVRAGDPRKDITQPIQVCSIQTLARRKQRIEDVTVVFIDEAHRAYSDSYVKHLFEAYPTAFFVGLSATPCRSDGKPLGHLFDHMVPGATYSKLIDEGHLAEPVVYSAPVLPDLGSCRTVGGDYNAEDLEEAVNKKVLIGNLLSEWQKRANGRRTVAFAVSVAHSKAIVEQFVEAGVRAEHLDGTTPEDERRAILARLASGETTLVSNVGVLCEGWDLPPCKCLLIARPTKSLVLYLQMAGRILRPWENVTPLILDHGGNVDRHDGLPHMDREWSLEGKQKKRTGGAPHKTCPECFAMIGAALKSCPHCGATMPEPPPAEPEAPKALDHVGLALRTLTGDDAQVSFFRATTARAREKGWHPGVVMHRFRERFGVEPPREWWHQVKLASRKDPEWKARREARTPPQWLGELRGPEGVFDERDIRD